jgi:hypothetical protein
LHCIRKIRNEFAHRPEKVDFSSTPVCDLCQAISYSKGWPKTDGTRGKKPESARHSFLDAVYFSIMHIGSQAGRAEQLAEAKHVWKEAADNYDA